ncbi:protein trichome birefringence-like 14 [Amborella trichopoda]|uniref:Uncharacterized protein n=1 Tax=Amborella trichopoda TaxID=13333 RepID=W1PCX8_AMBTC|nr:protein trichome birefringence-like 14 [Amborella trichopoda]ERN07762.1 hypothetical protein AMTR_s00012p00095940 [Amborella trichopoda]|eukprot:XP_006846087.1 protein trichome birefringence-like 14 [Amborella trichopoda]
MKSGVLNRLRGKQLSLTLIGFLCMTLVLWAWEKTPIIASILPPQSQFESLSQGLHSGSPPPPSSSATILVMPVPKERFSNEGEESYRGLEGEQQLEPSSSGLEGEQKLEPSSISLEPNINEQNDTKKECNYAKGRWLPDKNRPLYSGFGCKRWLSEMWACRLTQRTDFSYESFRWRPEGCEMPDFRGSSFLKRMKDKTIALVGDSLGRQQFQSLMCMATGGEDGPDVLDVGWEYGLVKHRGSIRPDGWAYRFPKTNTTILYYWSASLCELVPINRSDPNTDYAMHLDRPAFFLQQFIHKFDVLVLNTGHHWNRGKLKANRWVMYVNGQPNTNRRLMEISNAKNLTVDSVVKWVSSQLPGHPRKLKAFFRTISPRHFFNGDWNSGGSCDNTLPLSGGNQVLQEESSDTVAESAVRGTGVRLLDITALSQLRDEGHISRYSVKATEGVQDCLHWCLPGVPDTWNELLYAQL